MNAPLCDAERCQVPAAVEYFVLWTDGHTTYNVWRACLDHQTYVQFHLMTGAWSGGVKPKEFKTRSIL